MLRSCRNQPIASRAFLVLRGPMSPNPFPVVAVPPPVAGNPVMRRAWGDRDLLDHDGRHRAHMAVVPLSGLPLPAGMAPDPMSRDPGISAAGNRRRHFVDGGGHLADDDPRGRFLDHDAFMDGRGATCEEQGDE